MNMNSSRVAECGRLGLRRSPPSRRRRRHGQMGSGVARVLLGPLPDIVPFSNPVRYGAWDVARTAFLMPLVCVRVSLFFVTFVVGYILFLPVQLGSRLGHMGLVTVDLDEPINGEEASAADLNATAATTTAAMIGGQPHMAAGTGQPNSTSHTSCCPESEPFNDHCCCHRLGRGEEVALPGAANGMQADQSASAASSPSSEPSSMKSSSPSWRVVKRREWVHNQHPPSCLGKLLILPVRVCVRLLLFLSLGFHRLEVRGQVAKRCVAPILVSNHVSFLDPLFTFYLLNPIMVSARENMAMAVVGRCLRSLMIVPVDRSSPSSKKLAAIAIDRLAKITDGVSDTEAEDWPRLLLYPEGTTGNGTALLAFKVGAFTPAVPVQPITIRYATRGGVNPTWVIDGPGILAVMLRLMAQLWNSVEITFLPAVFPSATDKQDPSAFAQRVRRLMADALGVPCTDYTFEDVQLAHAAAGLGYPKRMAMVEFGKMERAFGIGVGTALEHLRSFVAMVDIKPTGDGKLSYRGLLRGWMVQDCQIMRRVFMFFLGRISGAQRELNATDQQQHKWQEQTEVDEEEEEEEEEGERGLEEVAQGKIDFRDYLAGLCYISQRGNGLRNEMMKAMMKALEEECATGGRGGEQHDGRISVGQLRRISEDVCPALKEEQRLTESVVHQLAVELFGQTAFSRSSSELESLRFTPTEIDTVLQQNAKYIVILAAARNELCVIDGLVLPPSC